MTISSFLKASFAGAVAITIAGAPAFAAHHEGDQEAVLEVVQSFFDALHARDSAAMVALTLDGAIVVSTRYNSEGQQVIRLRREDESTLAAEGPSLVERGFNPTVLFEGDIAIVWMPYDIYVDGAFLHCGIDAFTMIKDAETWKITSTAYSAVTDGSCEMHPDGPPN